jgi:RNA polymerase sigma-70 factor (ECF subfamily)
MRQNADEGGPDLGPPEKRDRVKAYLELAPRVRRIGARHSLNADDLVQDAYVRMLRGDREASIHDPVRYLFRIVRNLVVDRQRALARETKLFDSGADPEAVGGAFDPERILDGKQRLDLIMAAVRELPPRCREAFELLRFEGLSYAAIARRMGISTSMVEKHIAEAMARLVRTLDRIDGDGEPEDRGGSGVN